MNTDDQSNINIIKCENTEPLYDNKLIEENKILANKLLQMEQKNLQSEKIIGQLEKEIKQLEEEINSSRAVVIDDKIRQTAYNLNVIWESGILKNI